MASSHRIDQGRYHSFDPISGFLRKVPDEDPLPCGGTEKLRDEKFKWKPGDVMEFIGRGS